MALTEAGITAKQLCEAIDKAMPNNSTPRIDRILLLEELRQARLKHEQLAKTVGERTKGKI